MTLAAAATTLTSADPTVTISLTLDPGERWWGGAVDDGRLMPFGDGDVTRDLAVARITHGTDVAGEPSNQSAPVLVSTRGRVVAGRQPFDFTFGGGRLVASGPDVTLLETGGDLRRAFLTASARWFPASGLQPARELLSAPQYNTWIEQPYRPTQESVLSYADGVFAAGMEPGVLIIDDSWAPDYGTWEFDAARFPDPAGMIAALHDQGFRVMLWLVPFISPDSAVFRELEGGGLLLRDVTGETAIRRWWNGLSAVLDVSNPSAVRWLTDRLDRLVNEFGVDGFKFDGGDIRDFRADDRTHGGLQPVEMCEAWASIGLKYPFNEFRACWRMGGQPLAQRLQDKPPSWGADGIGSLIPEMLAQGMIGHPYVCPDMIGGGEIGAMSAQADLDQEFFVRYAQVAALAPMAQFSVAPARVLDARHLAAVDSAIAVRAAMLPTILALADHAAATGEPIVRPMAYHAPDLEEVSDQFFLGPDVIVAPVLTQGATTRRVRLPRGWWQGDDGIVIDGPADIDVPCDLASLPRFTRVGGSA